MRTSSAKAKGRRLQNLVRTLVLRAFPELAKADVKCAVMGEAGNDLHLSPRAADYFPFDVECKNVERLNFWGAVRQVEARATRTPLLVLARNRTEPWAALPLDRLLVLLRDRMGTEEEEADLRRQLALARDVAEGVIVTSPLD